MLTQILRGGGPQQGVEELKRSVEEFPGTSVEYTELEDAKYLNVSIDGNRVMDLRITPFVTEISVSLSDDASSKIVEKLGINPLISMLGGLQNSASEIIISKAVPSRTLFIRVYNQKNELLLSVKVSSTAKEIIAKQCKITSELDESGVLKEILAYGEKVWGEVFSSSQ